MAEKHTKVGLLIVGTGLTALIAPAILMESDLTFSMRVEPNQYDPVDYQYMVAALVVVQLVLSVYLIVRDRAAQWNHACLALGLPVSLFGATVVSTGMVLNLEDPEQIYPATAQMLVTIVYGGVISALGYFSRIQTSPNENGSLSNGSIATICIVLLATLVLAEVWGPGALTYFSYDVLSVFCLVFGTMMILSREVDFRKFSGAALFASILCLFFGLVRWYSQGGLDRTAVTFAMNGLHSGLFIYILAYVLSLRHPGKEKIQVGRANWHWLEVTAFLVFMLFAPETIRETLINQQDEEAALIANAQLEDRLALLEKRLALLEGSQTISSTFKKSQHFYHLVPVSLEASPKLPLNHITFVDSKEPLLSLHQGK